jgi:hypothetical protein
MGPPRLPLSVGYGPALAKRLVTLAILGVLLVVACGCGGAFIGTGLSALGTQGEPNGLVTALAAVVSSILALTYIGLTIAFVARAAAWLEGPVLTVRYLRTRSVDLRGARSAELSAVFDRATASAAGGQGVVRSPVLTVTGPEGVVRLRLRGRHGSLLPPHEMVALADALAFSPAAGAQEAAAWLRAMAADPRTLLL